MLLACPNPSWLLNPFVFGLVQELCVLSMDVCAWLWEWKCKLWQHLSLFDEGEGPELAPPFRFFAPLRKNNVGCYFCFTFLTLERFEPLFVSIHYFWWPGGVQQQINHDFLKVLFCPGLEISKIGNHLWHIAHDFWVVFWYLSLRMWRFFGS